ncbi:low temperature requirement protein A [Planomonospora venezuelensis]|uniref:Low temperature requirement protein LtrA n=1 Tax=Planomonospora venezuelensis TaxID=1999 RepID=A0A841D956_PLAVE|nr:low temperature requirement protein A [Planomonospora venezuelensis]MBB5965137.1 low temperature requirement protein LtrA [Planomonospora venezuelensis]GIN00414.1 low temperature requirement protein A [Planomonospora venezuelensis]
MRLPGWFAERAEPAPPETELRVSTLELFFDLVFVFTVTQLTRLVADGIQNGAPLQGALQALLVFGAIWWMYAGYAWLTNAIPPVRSARRVLILLGMAGFMIVALAIPTAFDGGGAAFAIGYLLLILVHAALYLQATAAISRVIPFNLGGVALIGAASLLGPPYDHLLWGAAVLLLWGSPYFIGQKGFELKAGHIVERHGLLVIVALGESIVALGIGAEGLPVGFALGLTAVLGLALAAGLWWVYFGGDDETRAEHALAGSEPVRRTRLVLGAYFYAHIPMLLGIVAVAAGVKKAIGHPVDPLKLSAAVTLAAGVTLFLAGSAWFRRVLGITGNRLRAAGAAAAPVTVAFGLWSALAQLTVLVALVVAVVVLGRRPAAAPQPAPQPAPPRSGTL